jgi:hypothetical protein
MSLRIAAKAASPEIHNHGRQNLGAGGKNLIAS